MRLPTAHVMAARDDAGLNAFSHPRFHYKVTNLSFHPDEITRAHAQGLCVGRMQPQRIRVRNFIQPLRVGTPCVNLNRETKRRDQNSLIRFELVGANMTLDVAWDRVFRPSPFSQRSGKELEPAARGWEAAPDCAVDLHANEAPAFFISVGTRNGNDIWRSGFRRAGEHATQMIFAEVFN